MSRGFPSMTALLGLLAVAGYQNRDKLAEMLGVKVSFVTVNPSSRIPFVTSGRIDYVMGAMTRNE